MRKMIEQLDVKDLKKAFNTYLSNEILPPTSIPESVSKWKNEKWRLFWNALKDKCSVVERT